MKKYMLGALVLGLIPIPILDLVAVAALQLEMLRRLTALYEVDFSEQLGTSVIGALVGGGASVTASVGLARWLLRLVPVHGWALSAAGNVVFAGASTYAVGRVFIQHFASGGTLLTFDPDKVRAYYLEQYSRGTDEVHKTFEGVKP